jgi:catechol 2,3-dioxygenase-like lactoylglutathione lyase family enzyme
MTARIKHVAISSGARGTLGRFYQTLFGFTTFEGAQEGGAMTDGYVGLNVNGRAPGRQAGFDHFGFEVDDVEQIFARAREAWPQVHPLKRPSSRPFASFSMHDPAGNVFDLTQRGLANRRSVYADDAELERAPRHISHLQLRAMDPAALSSFYQDLFDLEERAPLQLTDGVVTLLLAPWRIADYQGSGIERPALDHLGFEVESLDRFQADLDAMVQCNPELAPQPRIGNTEKEARLRLSETCPFGQLHLADPDGVLLDVSEA